MVRSVFINSAGKFLPGNPVSNEEMEARLGLIGNRPSGARRRILKQNGIRFRHYAIDENQNSLYSNAEMAALASRDAFANSSMDPAHLELLCAATSQGDLPLPGFASMVHGELGTPPCEVATMHGVCASGMMALKYAYSQIKSGDKENALVCASEFPSRLFKASRFEDQQVFRKTRRVSFDAEFLRWMLSDGAGAFILSDRAASRNLSLRMDWIDLRSYANHYDPCMYIGANKTPDGTIKRTWLDYPDYQASVDEGAMNLKQDIRMLDRVLKIGVDLYFELLEHRRFGPEDIDWFVCHYSSHVFKAQILELLEKGGALIPEERWFSNLYTRGNTGSASIFLMLEELLNSDRLKPGQRVLCMVPESGRFIASYMMLTVVDGNSDQSVYDQRTDHPACAPVLREAAGTPESGPGSTAVAAPIARAVLARTDLKAVGPRDALVEAPALPAEEQSRSSGAFGDQGEAPELRLADKPVTQALVRRLTRVWIDFENKQNQVPIIDRLNRSRFSLEDYRSLLYNLRQQVVEGSRWIGRAASPLDMQAFELRSMFLQHTLEEHRDFRMLEQNYVAVGGKRGAILRGEKNIGSEALSAWCFQRASQPNPLDLLGAMFIIEGLGSRMAARWGDMIRDQLRLSDEQVSFLLYHGANDENHFERLEAALNSKLITDEVVDAIVKTAKVTARLYLLQLEEINQF